MVSVVELLREGKGGFALPHPTFSPFSKSQSVSQKVECEKCISPAINCKWVLLGQGLTERKVEGSDFFKKSVVYAASWRS